jgi:2'-5' RNA ligase
LNDKKIFQRIIDKQKNGFIQKAEVKKLYLFESILQRKEPIYNVIKEFPL